MKYLTISEAAKALQLSVPTIKRYIYEGQLQSAKLPGGQHRIPNSEIERLLTPEGSSDRARAELLPQPNADERVAVLERWLTELQSELERQAATLEVLSRYCSLVNEEKPPDAECKLSDTEHCVLVLGPGCKKCQALYEGTMRALKAMGRTDIRLEHVKDLDDIAAFGPVVTPALVIDDAIVSTGRVPGGRALHNILNRHLS